MPNPDPTPRGSDFVADFGNGTLDDRLTAAIQEAAEQTHLGAGKSKVTITFEFTAKGDGLFINGHVATVLPKVKNEQFHFFGSNGWPSRRDPNQPALPNMEDAK